jgi:hypothetical protein
MKIAQPTHLSPYIDVAETDDDIDVEDEEAAHLHRPRVRAVTLANRFRDELTTTRDMMVLSQGPWSSGMMSQ